MARFWFVVVVAVVFEMFEVSGDCKAGLHLPETQGLDQSQIQAVHYWDQRYSCDYVEEILVVVDDVDNS